MGEKYLELLTILLKINIALDQEKLSFIFAGFFHDVLMDIFFKLCKQNNESHKDKTLVGIKVVFQVATSFPTIL